MKRVRVGQPGLGGGELPGSERREENGVQCSAQTQITQRGEPEVHLGSQSQRTSNPYPTTQPPSPKHHSDPLQMRSGQTKSLLDRWDARQLGMQHH